MRVPQMPVGASKQLRLDVQRRQREVKQEAVELRSQATRLRGEAARLVREAEAPRQIIEGGNEGVRITLITKSNLLPVLSRIQLGATVTWTGTRTAASPVEETWIISSIEKVEP